MSLYDVGRICMKIAGRDAGKACVVVETLDKNFVVVDGQTRRRKVNVKHLEPVNKSIKIKAKASHAEVKTAFTKLGLKVLETKAKKAAEKPTRVRKAKPKPAEKTKEKEQSVKKAETKEEKSKNPAAKTKSKSKKK